MEAKFSAVELRQVNVAAAGRSLFFGLPALHLKLPGNYCKLSDCESASDFAGGCPAELDPADGGGEMGITELAWGSSVQPGKSRDKKSRPPFSNN